MVKKVVRRLHYSEEYCYGFRVGLDWKPLTCRDQYSSCAPRLNIPNRDHHLLMPPYVHSISAGRPAVPDSAPVLVFLGLLESARGTAGGCLCLGDFVPHDSVPRSGLALGAENPLPTGSASINILPSPT